MANNSLPSLQVKFLVPNVAAGSIIGKSGANITEIQTQSNARMQVPPGRWREAWLLRRPALAGSLLQHVARLAGCGWFLHGRLQQSAPWAFAFSTTCAHAAAAESLRPPPPRRTFLNPPAAAPPARLQLSRASEFYPGSPEGQDRILLVSGTVNQLLTALHLVLFKLKGEPGALRAVQAKDGEAIQLRMLVHSRLCGTLIGKGGATIRSFNEDSRAVFNISPPPTLPGACVHCGWRALQCWPAAPGGGGGGSGRGESGCRAAATQLQAALVVQAAGRTGIKVQDDGSQTTSLSLE